MAYIFEPDWFKLTILKLILTSFLVLELIKFKFNSSASDGLLTIKLVISLTRSTFGLKVKLFKLKISADETPKISIKLGLA